MNKTIYLNLDFLNYRNALKKPAYIIFLYEIKIFDSQQSTGHITNYKSKRSGKNIVSLTPISTVDYNSNP